MKHEVMEPSRLIYRVFLLMVFAVLCSVFGGCALMDSGVDPQVVDELQEIVDENMSDVSDGSDLPDDGSAGGGGGRLAPWEVWGKAEGGNLRPESLEGAGEQESGVRGQKLETLEKFARAFEPFHLDICRTGGVQVGEYDELWHIYNDEVRPYLESAE